MQENVKNLLTPRLNEYIPHKPTAKQSVFLLLNNVFDVFYGGAVAGGKVQPLTGDVITPKGRVKMGDLKIGDRVSDPTTGGSSEVIAIHEQGILPFFRFIFDDGASIEVGLDHLWIYRLAADENRRPRTKPSSQREFASEFLGAEYPQERWNNWRIGDTRDIIRALGSGKGVRIPLSEPVLFDVNGRTGTGRIEPYLCGLMTGDGDFTNMVLTSADEEILEYADSQGFVRCESSNIERCPQTRAVKDTRRLFRNWLVNNDLYMLKAWDKFIPPYVFTANIEYRLAYLQGLMDTDGTVDDRGRCFYCTTSPRLASDVAELVRGLGGKARIRERITQYTHEGEKKDGRLSYHIRIWMKRNSSLFRLTRKKERCTDTWNGGDELTREVVSYERTGNKEGRCITVSSPYGLYLADDYIVTHNSDAMLMAALQYVDVPTYNALILRATFLDLALPGAIMDRSHEWLQGKPGVKWNDKSHTWTFPSGARLTFGYLSGPKDHYRYKCLTPDHEVLSEKGWVPISTVKNGDYVLTIDRKEHKMVYAEVSNSWFYELDNETLVRTKPHANVSFCSTQNHKVPVVQPFTKRFMFTTPKYVLATSHIPLGGFNVFPKQDTLSFPASDASEVPLTLTGEEFASLAGSWAGFGGIIRGRELVLPMVCEKLLLSLEHPINKSDLSVDRGMEYLKIKNSNLSTMLARGAFSATLPLPRGAVFWCQDEIELLFQFYLEQAAQNGYVEIDNYRDQGHLCHLAMLCGRIPKVEGSVMSFTELGNTVPLYDEDDPEPFEEIQYTGKVHCIEVPASGSFFIRHEGKVSLTGNSAEFQFVGIDEASDLVWEQMRYLCSRMRQTKDKAQVPLRFRLASNPGGISHDQIYDYYINPQTRAEGVVFVPAGLDDNPYIDKEEYIHALEQMGDPVLQAQLRHGDWDVKRKGTLFQHEWFMTVPHPPVEVVRRIRWWDQAASESVSGVNKDPDYSVGALVSVDKQGNVYIEDIVRGRWSPSSLERVTRDIAMKDGRQIPVYIEQEPGASGKAVIEHYQRNVLLGFSCFGKTSTGNKEEYAKPLSAAAEQRRVFMVSAPWNRIFLSEMCLFPFGNHDDQVDAVSKAYALIAVRRKIGAWGRRNKRVSYRTGP